MYHAPVSAELAPQELSPAEMPEDDAGYEGTSPIEDAQVQDRQAETAAYFAPFFATAGVAAALLAARRCTGTSMSASSPAGWP